MKEFTENRPEVLPTPRPTPRRDELFRRVVHIVDHEARTRTSWSETHCREFGEDVAHALFKWFTVTSQASFLDTQETPRDE